MTGLRYRRSGTLIDGEPRWSEDATYDEAFGPPDPHARPAGAAAEWRVDPDLAYVAAGVALAQLFRRERTGHATVEAERLARERLRDAEVNRAWCARRDTGAWATDQERAEWERLTATLDGAAYQAEQHAAALDAWRDRASRAEPAPIQHSFLTRSPDRTLRVTMSDGSESRVTVPMPHRYERTEDGSLTIWTEHGALIAAFTRVADAVLT